MKWVRLNLHRKVLLTLLAVGVMPAAVGVALTARQLWKVIRDVSADNLQMEARNIAGLLDREVNNFINRATANTSHPSVAALFGESEAPLVATSLTMVLSALWQDRSTTRPVFLLPRDGPLRTFAFLPGGIGIYPMDPQPYKLLESRRQTIPPNLKAVSVHTDPMLRRSVALVWLPVPPDTPAQFLGWLGVEIPVDWILRTEISRALFAEDRACVISSMGHLLGRVRFSPNRATELREHLSLFVPGTEERFEVRYSDGSRQLVGSSPLPLTSALRSLGRSDADWYICVSRDLRPLAEEFQRQIVHDLFIGIGLVLFLILIAYLLARRLIRPIRQLEEGVRRVAAGDLASRVSIHTGDELEGLAGAFNEMANRLQQDALDIQRQMATVRRQADELALLHEISRAINARLDLDQTLSAFARETSRVVAYDHLSVALLDEDGEHYTVQCVFPEIEASEFSPGTRHRLEESYVGEAVRAGRPVVRDNTREPPLRLVDEFLASAGLQSAMFVPLLSEARAIGSVNLASRNPAAFGVEEQERMALLAEAVAVAIQHSRLYTRVRRFAADLEAEVRRRTAQLRLAQDKLVQTEKLAASGQMAAGIAHEINNPLGIIKNYMRLTMDRLDVVSPAEGATLAKQNLAIMEEEINRIAGIVRSLLDLYHPREDSPVATDLHDLLDRVLDLFAPHWQEKGVQITRRFSPSLPPLIVSGDRIRQVFINLLRNAEDAMESGGTVTLTTRLKPASAEWHEDRIVIGVEDTGCGIPARDLPRVFDPFFTTKKGGTGTGLGLSVSYGIVRSYGGTIEIDSEPGRGTRVRVSLPLIRPVAASPKKDEGGRMKDQ
jgi:signal transduction histidine kinase